MSDAFKPLLAKLADGQALSAVDAETFLAACLRGEPTSAQIASAVTALRMRGETVEEITAFAKAMRAAALKLEHPYAVIDTCGTGGDGQHTYNISTAAAFVAAGGGLKVAKHGTRALSSRSGSSDVLTALGVNVACSLEASRKALDEANICFLFAPAHHSAMRHVLPVRAELGFRTVFNLLGPLSNPAGAQRQVLGVYDPGLVEPMAKVLGGLGIERAWTVHGSGLDELSTAGETQVCEWKHGQTRRFTITPEAVGLERVSIDALRGGSPEQNAEALRAVLSGQTGAYRDIVALNAAAAFLVSDLVETLMDGIALSFAVIDDGRALTALDRLVSITQGQGRARV